MSIFTAKHFVNAEFAKHPDGRLAVRSDPWDTFQWNADDDWRSDESMAYGGWAPVPLAPGVTETAAYEIEHKWTTDLTYKFSDVLSDLGVEVIPTPMPTNEDQLHSLLWSHTDLRTEEAEVVAKALDKAGVKAPEGNA